MVYFTPFDDPVRLEPTWYPKETDKRRLAEAIVEVTEAAREADRLARPDDRAKGLLSGGLPERHPADDRHWYEYLAMPTAIAACARRLGLQDVEFLRAFHDLGFMPANWQVFFWMYQYYGAETQIERIVETANAFIAEQQAVVARERTDRARAGGLAKDAMNFGSLREYVKEAWVKDAHRFNGNKSAFARDITPVLQQRFGAAPTQKTITDVWLKGL